MIVKNEKYYRVGILGTENSHAMAFTKTLNTTNDYPDFKVTALYALDRAPSEKIVAECGTDISICGSIDEMLDSVDCVMVTARHGKYHLPFARRFIEKGMPAFIDKPFTISPEDADELLRLAEEHNVPLCGGSGCKYSDDLTALKAEIAEGKFGRVNSAVIQFPADLESEYGGFYFYASHLTEMTTALFGRDIKTITAFAKCGKLSAVAGYDDMNVYMNFASNYSANVMLWCEKEIVSRTLSIDTIHEHEVKYFTDMVRTGKAPYPPEELMLPVRVMNAIERSLTSGMTENV